MTCAIKAGDTIFAGSQGEVHATRAADGKQLWSRPVPGKVTDLAFQAGRLFAVTDQGSVVCLAPGQ